jgi:hypothetical protein
MSEVGYAIAFGSDEDVRASQRLMVFQDKHAAERMLENMEPFGGGLYEVQLEAEPEWHPRKKALQGWIAWCDVRWDDERGGLVGRQAEGERNE